jgi:ribosomal protein S27AE
MQITFSQQQVQFQPSTSRNISEEEEEIIVSTPKYCPLCGEKLQQSIRFCPNCGSKIT